MSLNRGNFLKMEFVVYDSPTIIFYVTDFIHKKNVFRTHFKKRKQTCEPITFINEHTFVEKVLKFHILKETRIKRREGADLFEHFLTKFFSQKERLRKFMPRNHLVVRVRDGLRMGHPHFGVGISAVKVIKDIFM